MGDAGPSTSSPALPAAGQANLIRAEQKDETYLGQLVESCHDAVRRLFGPGRAMLWARETRTAAELLYYGLTTGTGLSTLGEEYCDILQAQGPLGAAPSLPRRAMLALLQTLGPYAAGRALAPVDEEAAAWAAERAAQRELLLRRESAPSTRGSADGRARSPRSAWEQLRAAIARALARLRGALARSRGVAGVLSFLREHGGTLMRCHLALFYVFGTYYQLPKRLAGVRFVTPSRGGAAGPTYRALGVLLLLQLGLTGGLALRARLRRARVSTGQSSDGTRAAPDAAHALLLDAKGRRVADAPPGRPASEAGQGDVPARQRCPLCLSARTSPTAAPCGHIFCWACIAEWAAQKPECPLCRADCPTAELVCLAHTDF